MIITSIKPQKNKKRVNIYLDSKFGFGIDLDNFVLERLKVNQELSNERVLEVVKKAEFQKTLDKLLMFATLRPRSKKEVELWLSRKKIHESLHEELFNRLNDLKLINDESFALWWVEQRNSFRPKSKTVLRLELRNKGIDKELIDKALDEINVDETAVAQGLLEKRMYKWTNLPKYEAKQKMGQYLASKGFTWELIVKVVSKVVK